jgi:hypothetical protein
LERTTHAARPAKARGAPFKRTFTVALFGPLAAVSLAACVAYPAHAAGIEVEIAPPPPRVIEVPPPRHGYVWAPGYWRYEGRRHVWVDGRWMKERRGRHWVADHWEPHDGHYRYERGHWER